MKSEKEIRQMQKRVEKNLKYTIKLLASVLRNRLESVDKKVEIMETLGKVIKSYYSKMSILNSILDDDKHQNKGQKDE